MATERLSMRQIREILRQKWGLGRTHREVARSLGISTGAVGATVVRARAAGLAWAQVKTLSDEALHARVYGPPAPPTHHRPVPDCAGLHAERRKPGVTLELLHLEYLEQRGDANHAIDSKPPHPLLRRLNLQEPSPDLRHVELNAASGPAPVEPMRSLVGR
jgi:hypothetical protein